MEELRNNIEMIAKEENKAIIDIISNLQAAAKITNNDALLDQLCELKWEYI